MKVIDRLKQDVSHDSLKRIIKL